jgi:glycosyltransferase involved in cell wall biosynthesis
MPFDVILTCNYSPWSSYSGGGQKSTHMIACSLASKGKRVCVVYSKSPLEAVTVPNGLPYTVKWAFFFAVKPGISSIFRFLNGISYYFLIKSLSSSGTVIHSCGDEGSLLGFIPNKKKFIYTNRYPNLDSYLFNADWSKLSTWVRIIIRERRFAAMSLAIKYAAAVTATSTHSRDQVLKCFSYPGKCVALVPNGIDPVFLQAQWEGASTHGILYFGRLTHAKGVDILLKAFSLLSDDLKHAHPLLITGDGPYKKNLIEMADRLGIKAFVKFRSWAPALALASLISQHRVIALPSREESFGNTMLEALAVGAPLITTNAGSIPEVVGDKAVVVPSEDPGALHEAILGLLNDSETPEFPALCQQRKSYAEAMFSWDKTAELFMELYEQ